MPVMYAIIWFDAYEDEPHKREYFGHKKYAVLRMHELQEKIKGKETDSFLDENIYGIHYRNQWDLIEWLELLNTPEKCEKLEYKIKITF